MHTFCTRKYIIINKHFVYDVIMQYECNDRNTELKKKKKKKKKQEKKKRDIQISFKNFIL